MFYGENLEYMRQLNGLSRSDLAQQIGVSEQAIWQYEAKNVMPEINKIHQLCQLFKVKSYFFLKQRDAILNQAFVDIHRIAFRAKNQKSSNKLLNRQHKQSEFISNFTNYLFSHVSQPKLKIYEIINEIDKVWKGQPLNKELINRIAEQTRRLILGSGTNQNLLLEIEKMGIVVYEQQLDMSTDAFSFWSNDETPYIILGDNKGIAVRRNFDIAHELGHLLLHRQVEFDLLTRDEYKDVEKEADWFAAHFLLPEKRFMEDFNQISKKSNPDYFVVLKEKWHVSIQAMAMRAYALKGLTDSQYRYFWSLINKKGFKKSEPLDNTIELPKPVKINSLMDLLFRKQVLTPEQILDDYKVEPEFFHHVLRIHPKLFYKFMEEYKEKQQNEIVESLIHIHSYH